MNNKTKAWGLALSLVVTIALLVAVGGQIPDDSSQEPLFSEGHLPSNDSDGLGSNSSQQSNLVPNLVPIDAIEVDSEIGAPDDMDPVAPCSDMDATTDECARRDVSSFRLFANRTGGGVNGAEKLGHWDGGIVYHLPDDLGP